VWYSGGASEGLRSVGEEALPSSKSMCSILPIARLLRAGVLRGSGFYTALGRAVVLPHPSGAAFRFAPETQVLRGTSGGATIPISGGSGAFCLESIELSRARRTGCLIGSEPPRYSYPEATGLRSFALALSPVPMP
jgi:hypothetical protein